MIPLAYLLFSVATSLSVAAVLALIVLSALIITMLAEVAAQGLATSRLPRLLAWLDFAPRVAVPSHSQPSLLFTGVESSSSSDLRPLQARLDDLAKANARYEDLIAQMRHDLLDVYATRDRLSDLAATVAHLKSQLADAEEPRSGVGPFRVLEGLPSSWQESDRSGLSISRLFVYYDPLAAPAELERERSEFVVFSRYVVQRRFKGPDEPTQTVGAATARWPVMWAMHFGQRAKARDALSDWFEYRRDVRQLGAGSTDPRQRDA